MHQRSGVQKLASARAALVSNAISYITCTYRCMRPGRAGDSFGIIQEMLNI